MGAKADAAEPHYHGHRERLRVRFREVGPEALADYELLELLLFRAKPRGDAKPLAKALLKRFGSLTQVVSAPEHLLAEIDGIGPAIITDLKIIAAAAHRFARETIVEKPVLASWAAVLDYCRTVMAFAEREEFRLLFLDKRNMLIADEVQQRGTVDHTPVYVREVVRRALELSATAFIMVHNHPSGDPTPSTADIAMTLEIVKAVRPFGIEVHDHIIVGRRGHTSFKALKLI